MDDNNNESPFIYTETDRQFILNFWHEASETINYLNDHFGISADPFGNPGNFAFNMIQKGVNDALSRLPIVNEFWNAKVTLTEEVINEIENELSGDESNRDSIIQMIHQQEEEQQL